MLITNAKLITWEEENRIVENQALYIERDRIVEVGPMSEMINKYPAADRLDAKNQYVMPGNICAHTHFYGAYARGMAIPGVPPRDFLEILQKLWWPLDRSLDQEAIKASTQVMLLDAIRHGTTTLFDHHASPNAIEGSLDVIAEEIQKSGLRAVLCYEVTDRDGQEKAQAGIKENIRFFNQVDNYQNSSDRIAAMFGLHASLTLSEKTLELSRNAAPDNMGFHIHVAEDKLDEYNSLQVTGVRVVERLQKHNILGNNSIVAHAVHIDINEAEILAETGTWVTHQPRSNMNNGVGVADVESFLHAGLLVGMGTDGFSHTMWDEWKTAYLLAKGWNLDPQKLSAIDVIRMGVYNNAQLAGMFFPDAPLGTIIQGAYADLIFVDYHPYTPLTPGNLPWHIIFGFNESMITTTMVAGELLMHNGEILTLDEEEITAKAVELAPAVWGRYQAQFSG
jgi:putative selenium metabolism protein SsnA